MRTLTYLALALSLASCEPPAAPSKADDWRDVEVVIVNKCESSWTDAATHTVVKDAEGRTWKVRGAWGNPGDKLKLNASASYWVDWNK